MRHHIPVNGLCRICCAHREDLFHALMHCPHASALWEAMREVWEIPRVSTPARDRWLEAWLLSMPMKLCDRVLMIVWRVWHARNEVTHGKPLSSTIGSRRFICSYVKSRPPVGTVKLNIDGAYIDQTGVAGAGMILRRDDGSIVFSACRALRFCSSALESELSACLEGVC
jgi:hypothetical protein